MNAQAGRSFYEALGVPPDAQKQDIRNAYRRLALRYHPDKNQGNSSAKDLFQEIQAAYETLSADDRRKKYDTTAGFVQSSRSTRVWREPSYGPCRDYAQEPPFWSVELRAMTVQKCARITRIQHLEREIQELVIDLEDSVAAEDQAIRKAKKAQAHRFSFTRSRASKLNAQRQRDFLAKTAYINTHLDWIKDELRTAYDDHKRMLERDNERKSWWARERVRRVVEENRRAATTAAEAARRRAERARREHRDRDRDPEAADENERRREQDEAAWRARAAKLEEEARIRAERARRENPELVRRRQEEASEWLAQQRRQMDAER